MCIWQRVRGVTTSVRFSQIETKSGCIQGANDGGDGLLRALFSLPYLFAMVLLALTAAVLSYLSPSRTMNTATLLLSVYALHLIGLRVQLRRHVSGEFLAKQAKAEQMAEIASEREQLEIDRRELDDRALELRQKIEAAEQQWELLRSMIRHRVERSEDVSISVG
jgi:ABC-type multidrug transport system fused ATPase/permease subunit